MGGSTYDRDVYSGSSSSGWGNSSYSASRLSSSTLDSSLLPNGKIIESKTKTPIIVVLDVTGSNINFARVVYDKMPMFYGQIEQQGYLKDFDISFCAVGDAYTDDYPMQICDFAKGIELDSHIEKLVLEGYGGGQEKESYELMAYYLYKNAKFAPGSEPIIFFIGDEAPYSFVNEDQARRFGIELDETAAKDPFNLLRKKVNDNVFMLLNPYNSQYFKDTITNAWVDRLAPEHVIKIKEQKSVVDLMLGIIAMKSKSRTLAGYIGDMKGRDQTQERIENVTSSLRKLSQSFLPTTVKGNIPTILKTGDDKPSGGHRL